MIGHEFYKLIKNSVLLPILAVSLLINAMLLIYYCNERAELYTNNEVIAEQHKILVNSYSDDIDDIILHAQNNLKEFDVLGFSNSDYNVKYQHFVINHYSAIRDTIEFSSQPVSGWDIYFSYRTGDIFILCFLLLASILIFTTDHITGMYHIVYTTKNGRMKTAVSKIILSAIVSFAVSIIFVVEQLIIVGSFFSFSQPFASIQNIEQFYLCPFQITIIQLFIVSLFLKCLSSYMFCMVIETISAFLSHYVVIYLSGLGFLCLNIVLYSITYVNKENLLNTTNIINAMNALLYYERVHTADFFNRIIPLQKYVTVLYSVFSFALAILIILKYSKKAHFIKRTRIISAMLDSISMKKKNYFQGYHKSIHIYNNSVVKWEFYKTIHRKSMIVFGALLIIRMLVSYIEYEPILSYSDEVYCEYMTTLAGEITQEKREYILTERQNIDQTISLFPGIQAQYYEKEINSETYRIKLNEYNVAVHKSPVLQRIESHVEYIDMEKQAGKNVWFVYDTGWIKLFFSSFDWTLYAMVLLLSINIFSSEYKGNSSSQGLITILRTTRNGRLQTFCAKYCSSIIISFIAYVMCYLMDMIFLNTYRLPLMSAPLQSIEVFATIDTNMSIGTFYMLYVFIKLLSVLLLALMFCSISALLTKNYLAMIVSTAITVVPHILCLLGVKMLRTIDYVTFMKVVPCVLEGNIILFICYVLVVNICLVFLARKKWCK